MSTPPEALLEPLRAQGEEPIGSLLTAGAHAFVTDEGDTLGAAIWWFVTERRSWLVAATGDRTWAVAVGGHHDVSLQKGWTWDAVRVGLWEIPLRNGTRASAASLLKKWREQPAGGDRFPPPVEAALLTEAPVAGGADLPEGWAENVPGEADEYWLMAVTTGLTHPFNTRKGAVDHRPLFLGASDRRIVLAAWGPDGRYHQVVPPPLALEKGTTRTVVHAGKRQLKASLFGSGLVRIAELSQLSRTGRWAATARHALEDGKPEAALRHWRDALTAGVTPPWTDLAQVCSALDAPQASVALLAREPLTDVGAARKAWVHDIPLFASLPKKLGWAQVRGSLRSLIDNLDLPEPPDGMPWPPEGPLELFAHALARQERIDEAMALFDERDDPRGKSANAALITRWRPEDADAAWVEAAFALRATGEMDAARRAVERVSGDNARWIEAAWAWADGDEETAAAHWQGVLHTLPDQPLRWDLDAAGWRTLAEHASDGEHWALADLTLAEAIKADPRHLASRLNRARVLDEGLGDTRAALEVLEGCARGLHAELFDDPPEAHWPLFVDLARLRILHQGDPVDALKLAIAHDFLHAEAYRAALSCPGVTLPPALEGWWRHVLALLSDEDGGEATPPATLDATQLDALHPGGVGWLESVRHRMDANEPPDRTTLVRGLEQITAERWPREHALLVEVCNRLGMDAPPTYLYRGDGSWGFSAWPTNPPVLLVGWSHLEEGERKLSDAALSFGMAVELAHLRCNHPLMAFDAGLVGTSQSVYQTFGKYAGTAENIVDVVTLLPGVDQLKKLETVFKLSRKVFTARSVVDRVSGVSTGAMSWMGWTGEAEDVGTAGREGWQGAALQFRMQADRAALLVTGDLRSAVDAILRSSTEESALAEPVAERGLAAVLAERPLGADTGIRVLTLLEFAATSLPPG